MQTGFFGKCFIAISAGFFAAVLYHYVWMNVIVGADRALNEGYRHRTTIE